MKKKEKSMLWMSISAT